MAEAFRWGFSVDEVYEISAIDTWFLVQIKELVDFEEELQAAASA